MARMKERKVKDRIYLYVYSSASYKGEKKVFEKSIGPKDGDKDELERKRLFYSALVDIKKEFYLTYLEVKHTKFQHLSEGYAFPLIFAKRSYHQFLSKLYPNDLEKYKEEFEVRYVYNTTTIEGNTLTLRETAMVLDRGIAPKTKELREIYEVENYKRLRGYVENYTSDITLKFIRKLHDFIQRNIDDDSAGYFRKIPIGISGSKWEPPPAIVVEEELNGLLKWYKENKKILHPIELAGIFHHKFLQIHPFKDGNGRVAREIVNFILERNNYPPIIIPVTQRLDYFELLSEADEDNIIPLLEFFSMCILEDYAKALSTIKDDIMINIGTLSEKEGIEILETIFWFVMLIKEELKKVPDKLNDKINEILGIDDNSNPIDLLKIL
jgi:fido (protein-threonine AMPylation protein)